MNKMRNLVSDMELDPYVEAVLGKKVVSPVLLDVRGLTSVADAFVICSGRSNRQVTAIGEFIRRNLKDQGIRPLSIEGLKDGHWILLDYGHIVIHVFYEPLRTLYDLEGLWIDAERTALAVEQTSQKDQSTEKADEP